LKNGRDVKRTDETAESRRGSKKGLRLRGGRRRRRKRRNCNYFIVIMIKMIIMVRRKN
jgi:hypothetical protein